jgi:hypothetical protein
MGLVEVKSDNPNIHQFVAQTNKYKLTFVGPETDECNLNIFIGTNKFKTIDEWMLFFL